MKTSFIEGKGEKNFRGNYGGNFLGVERCLR